MRISAFLPSKLEIMREWLNFSIRNVLISLQIEGGIE